MKRLFISFFILVSLVPYAQTEIWGTKTRAGENNGGVLFKIDSASNTIENQYVFFGELPNAYDGCFPRKIAQMEDGSIIGNTMLGGEGINIYNSRGVLYHFDPITKDYEVLKRFSEIDNEAYLSDFFLMEDDQIILFFWKGIYPNYSNYIYQYDYQNNSIQFLDSVQLENDFKIRSILKESDSSLLLDYNQQLERFYPMLNERESLGSFEVNGDVNNLQFLNENTLIYGKYTEDSSLLKKYDINTSVYETIWDMREFYPDAENSVMFDFKVMDDEKLVGSMMYITQKKNWFWVKQLMELDLETQETKTIGDSYSNEYYGSNYLFINNYQDMGDYFCINQYDQGFEDCGFLRYASFQFDEFYKLDQFQVLGWFPEEDDFNDYRYLAKFMSTQNTQSVSETLKDGEIQIYFHQDQLSIVCDKRISNAQITIFDMSGRLVDEFSETDFTQISRPIHLSPGGYIVQISSKELNESHKILVD